MDSEYSITYRGGALGLALQPSPRPEMSQTHVAEANGAGVSDKVIKKIKKDALKKSLAPRANVRRNGRWVVVEGRELVPGDLVVLALGGAVPADCRLLAGKEIGVDQAALTGESLPVTRGPGDTVFMGSVIRRGQGRKRVIQRLFNVGVLEAMSEKKASTL